MNMEPDAFGKNVISAHGSVTECGERSNEP